MNDDISEKAKKLTENATTKCNGLNPYQEEELSDVAEQQKLRNMGITKEMSMLELYITIQNDKHKSNKHK